MKTIVGTYATVVTTRRGADAEASAVATATTCSCTPVSVLAKTTAGIVLGTLATTATALQGADAKTSVVQQRRQARVPQQWVRSTQQ